MAWISPSLVLTIFLAAPFIGTGTIVYSRVARRLATQSQKALGSLNKIGNERLESIRTVQAFAAESKEVGRYNTQVRKLFNIGKTQALMDARFFALNGWLGNMIVIGLLWHGGSLVRDGFLSLGDLTTFMMYAVYAGTSVIGVTSFLSELMKASEPRPACSSSKIANQRFLRLVASLFIRPKASLNSQTSHLLTLLVQTIRSSRI